MLMEEWIKVIAPPTSMATKAELNAVKSDLRDEIGEVKSDMTPIKSEQKFERFGNSDAAETKRQRATGRSNAITLRASMLDQYCKGHIL